MKFRFIKFAPFIVLVLFSCHTKTLIRHKADISDIKIDKIKIGRYEQALFSIDKSNLKTELEKLQPHLPDVS